jgi:hypothetical protein
MNPKLVDDKRDRPYIPNPIRSGNVQPTQFPKKINALEDEECVDGNISSDYPVGDELEVSTSKH